MQKRILLGVTGSISAYKSYDILRGLLSEGHEVIVVLTSGAEKFIKKESFAYLGAKEVYSHNEDFGPHSKSEDILHIRLARWCDKLCVVPLSANTLSSFVSGSAQDLLTSIFLALGKREVPKLFFPAMNTQMLNHPFVEENLKKLASLPQTFIHPTSKGVLACKEEGEGRLAPVEEVVDLISSFSQSNPTSLRFLLTTGATLTALDPVRYLTNPSSGITGHLLAKEILSRGHRVSMIAGESSTSQLDHLNGHPDYKIKRVKTNNEMLTQVKSELDSAHIYISSAAICDFKFNTLSEQKIKKDELPPALEISPDEDILKFVLERKPELYSVGFAAESHLTDEVMLKKWQRKPTQLLVGTKVGQGSEVTGFKQEKATYLILKKNKQLDPEFLSLSPQEMSKKELAKLIVNNILKDLGQ